MRRPLWVVMTYVVLLLLAVTTALPNFLPVTARNALPDWATSQTVSLGLDLQGGAHLLLAVDRDDLAQARLQDLRETLAAEMQALNQSQSVISSDGLALSVRADDALFAVMQDLAAATAQPGTPVDYTVTLSDGVMRLALTSAGLDRAAMNAADSSLEVIRERIDQVGVSEPVISRVGEDRILVQMPGVENPAQLRDLLGSTAKMSFQMVARRSGTGVSLLEMRDGSGVIPVENRVALSGDRLDQAAMGFDPDTGRPMVTFAFDRQGAITFAEITAANIGQRFAVVLDGQVLTAPVIQSMIPGGQGQITGDFTSEEAQTLAVLLTSGALPASLEVIEERSVGAALGADSIRSGLITDFIEPWTQQVTECTNGEVQFEIFPAGTQMGNVARQQEQVMAGVVDIAHGLHGIPRGRFPATSLIDMPFLTDDAGAASYALWELFPEYLSDEYNGLKVLALHAHNGGVLHTNEKKVETIEDMKGLRIRTPSPAVSEMLSFLGADPQGLPPGEVYESLQRGVIDGTVFPWDPIKSFGLNEVLNYHLELGAYTVSFFFVMNERSYEGLSEEAQACVDKYSGGDLVAKFGDWWDMWDAPGRQDAIDAGHQITELSDEQRAQWEETLQPMMDAYLQSVKDAGVDNAEEIYLAMQDKIAEYEAAQQD